MKKVKNILFRMDLKGNGIVNYDNSDQKWMFKDTNLKHMSDRHDNTSFSKKKFYKDGEKLSYKVSISSDCLRHDIFKDDVLIQSPNIINNEYLLYSFIASPTSLLRGYLFAEDKETLKRKGVLCITDAEQTCNAVTSIETFSRSGMKNKDSDKTDNTFFKKEVVGDIEYSTMGNIDLMQLQFVSCDQVFDRYSFNPDMFNIYKEFLKSKLPTFNSELGYYQIKNSIVQLSEYGFKMNNESVLFMVKELFEKLLKLNIRRKGSFAECSKLQYKLVYDVLDDTFNNEDGWVTINNKSDIDKLSFETEDFYLEEDITQAKEKRKLIEEDYQKRKLATIEKKKEQKESSKKAKTPKSVPEDDTK